MDIGERQAIPEQASFLDREFDVAEAEGELLDEAYYAAILLQDIWVKGSTNALDADAKANQYPGKIYWPGRDGRLFIQPSVPHPSREKDGSDFYEVVEIPVPYHDKILAYETPKRLIVRVPQVYIMEIHKDRNPYIFLTMTTCSAVIGERGNSLWVAHVGLSEKGGLRKVMELLMKNGVCEEDLYAVARIPSANAEPDIMSDNPAYDYRRLESIGFLRELGIPEGHISTFDCYPADRPKPTVAGVFATKEYIGTYLFDVRKDWLSGNEKFGDIRGLQVIRF